MVDGQSNNIRVGAIIQARNASTRLPGKVLLPLPFNEGKPILQIITNFLKRNTLLDEIIIATSSNIENDNIRNFAELINVKCFSGSENNVLSRFVSVIKQEDLDICIRLTADNPLIDNNTLNNVVHYLIENELDYAYTSGMPLGMNIEAFKASSLLKSSSAFSLTDEECEHVTLFMKRSGHFKVGMMNVFENDLFKDIRCTIDYPSDFAFMNLVLSVIDTRSDLLNELNSLIIKYPWIVNVNKNFQKIQGLSFTEEVLEAVKLLEKVELKRVAKFLKESS